MSQGSRNFDPEAVDEFVSLLEGQMAVLRSGVIEAYFEGEGPLRRMPAFGVGGNADALRAGYARFHAGAWADVHALLFAYQGFVEALEGIKESNADTEDANVTGIEGQV